MIDFGNFTSLIQIADYFNTNEICKEAIAQERWADGKAVCPYCGCTHCYKCSDGRYFCSHCKNKFSVLVGTIFENTKISLRKWFMAMYLISSHKKGISSCQLSRDINITQKAAWFILQKLRGLYGQDNESVLNGQVEMDEMYLGGRETNKHQSKKVKGTQGRSTKTKTPIFGIIERKDGNVIAMKVTDTKGATLMPIIGKYVSKESDVFTDELVSYVALDKNGYSHQIVNHGKREFVRAKDIHTNSIEGFWAHFKRVVFGTYHCVSKDYLQRYIDEQVYRWNTRKATATERFIDMFAKSVKSFGYKDVLTLSTLINEELWAAKHRSYYHSNAA